MNGEKLRYLEELAKQLVKINTGTTEDEVSREKKSVNLDQVQWQMITDDANISSVLKQNSISSEETSANLAELQKLQQFNTYEEVKDCGQQTLSTRWVNQIKRGRQRQGLLYGDSKKNL